MTLDEIITRLNTLREVVGHGDIPVTRSLDDGHLFGTAACELAYAAPAKIGWYQHGLWVSPDDDDASDSLVQIVSIF